MRLVDRHEVIEEVLDEWASSIGPARLAYRGHVYRVYNLARSILGSGRLDDDLAVASAFHDLGIWSDRTFDYLPPSVARARAYVRDRAPRFSADLVANAIENHHRLGRVRSGAEAGAVEAFRRADLVDLSGGRFRAGLEKGLHRELVAAFPYSGFHGVLVRTALPWFVRHPLRPLPMMRL